MHVPLVCSVLNARSLPGDHHRYYVVRLGRLNVTTVQATYCRSMLLRTGGRLASHPNESFIIVRSYRSISFADVFHVLPESPRFGFNWEKWISVVRLDGPGSSCGGVYSAAFFQVQRRIIDSHVTYYLRNESVVVLAARCKIMEADPTHLYRIVTADRLDVEDIKTEFGCPTHSPERRNERH